MMVLIICTGQNKYGVLLASVTFALFALSLTDAWTGQYVKVKTVNGNCIHPHYNVKIPDGKAYFPKKRCETHVCRYSRKAIDISGCGVVMVAKGCVATADTSKDYPDCCLTNVTCPKPVEAVALA